MTNVTPIRPTVELGYVDRELQATIARELSRDIDRITLEARNRGRLEGMLAASIFVIIGLGLASLITL